MFEKIIQSPFSWGSLIPDDASNMTNTGTTNIINLLLESHGFVLLYESEIVIELKDITLGGIPKMFTLDVRTNKSCTTNRHRYLLFD